MLLPPRRKLMPKLELPKHLLLRRLRKRMLLKLNLLRQKPREKLKKPKLLPPILKLRERLLKKRDLLMLRLPGSKMRKT
jgi:hypothetical protein